MDAPERITELQQHPERLDELSPREFEELIAELLAFFGWDVNLTSQTRDGGYDILGVSRDATGLESTWAVECKHYAQDHAVSVEVLRSLYGVKHGLGFPQALLVTTSRLTRDAPRFADSHADIRIVEKGALLDWLARYRGPSAATPHATSKRFQSCFVSYSHRNEEFAVRLVERLRAEGVRVWFAPEDLNPGTKVYEEIAKAIEGFDRLIVVLSENSMRSMWVQTEIRKARQREVRDGCRVLFPISLVPFEVLKKWELFDANTGQDIAVELREYLIPDFSSWKDSGLFEKQVSALVKGLRATS